jgi:phage replication O-like protein O
MRLPNYTQLNNDFISEMHKFSGNAVKVFIAISRKTIGWHKISDRISHSQLKELTGIKHHVTLMKAIKELEGFVKQRDSKFGYVYDLAMSDNSMAMSENDTVTMSKIDTTKDTVKETNKEKKIDMPEKLNCKEFLDTWDKWIDYRKSIKKKMTHHTIELQLKKLEKMGQSLAILSLNNSMENGYTGIFEPKGQQCMSHITPIIKPQINLEEVRADLDDALMSASEFKEQLDSEYGRGWTPDQIKPGWREQWEQLTTKIQILQSKLKGDRT